MPKVKLIVDGPYAYSDGTFQKGDVFYVGPKACEDGVKNKTFEFVEYDPPPPPYDPRPLDEKYAAALAEIDSLNKQVAYLTDKNADLEGMLEKSTDPTGTPRAAEQGQG